MAFNDSSTKEDNENEESEGLEGTVEELELEEEADE